LGVFPLIDRKTPVLDRLRLRGSPVEFRERPLLGFLAETPEEVRGLRRGVAAGFGTVLALTLFMAPLLTKLEK